MTEIKNKKGEVIFTYNVDSLKGANLSCVDLCGANLRGANLSNADFSDADLRCANLFCANLRGADISYANLHEADLSGANLSCADLRFADFSDADLRCANLSGADLRYADLRGADLTDIIIDETTKGLNDKCPKTGSFIGYKKCIDNFLYDCIVELEIPADARRSSSTTNKCRCDKAKVLSITYLGGIKTDITEVHSIHNYDFVYKVGEIVTEPNFDEKYWNECSSGIHFFIDRKDAVFY